MDALLELKLILREEAIPFFTDEELNYYLTRNSNNISGAAYELLIVKSENTTLSISGLNTADTSQYFRRLAQNYRPNNSGILGGRF